MTYYGYQSDESLCVVSGEHMDALRALYGYEAVRRRTERILREIEKARKEKCYE